MVRVLAQYDDTHRLGRGEFQGTQRLRREHHRATIQALLQKCQQAFACSFFEKRIHQGPPARRHGPVGWFGLLQVAATHCRFIKRQGHRTFGRGVG